MAKILFTALDPVSSAVFKRNREYCHGLGLQELRPNSMPLAVVGGGHSTTKNIKELQDFDGEVWAINEAFQWCNDNNIKATFYAIDPSPDLATVCGGVKKAILGDTCDPSLFEALKDAEIQLAEIRGPNGIQATISAAATAPFIASRIGHTHLTYFGCEGSFETTTHLYEGPRTKNAPNPRLWVNCGGTEYLTTSQYVMGTEFIADVARMVPTWITAADDGFLAALIKHGDYDVTHVSREIQNALEAAA